MESKNSEVVETNGWIGLQWAIIFYGRWVEEKYHKEDGYEVFETIQDVWRI